MKIYYHYYLFYFIIFFSCHSQVVDKKNNTININLKFYPIGVIENTRYSIFVKNDSFIVKDHFPLNDEINTEFSKKMSQEQLQVLNHLISKIDSVVKNEPSYSSDTWEVSLRINNKLLYEKSDFSFDTPPDNIKNLIQYLVKLSPIKIDLYGFS